jgi:putative acetyltransferase
VKDDKLVPTLVRTNSHNPDFISLVRHLDADLAVRDGQDHAYYAQFNKIDAIKHVVIAYLNDQPVGCGAIKAYGPGIMEVKRMFVPPENRKQGIAGKILTELERWGMELSCSKFVLETGKRQPEAIGLYEKHGYTRIPNYGQYAGMENSVCFEKALRR